MNYLRFSALIFLIMAVTALGVEVYTGEDVNSFWPLLIMSTIYNVGASVKDD